MDFNDVDFDELILKIRQNCGIDLEMKKWQMKPKLQSFCQDFGLNNFRQLSSKVDLNLPIRQSLYDFITVCETYFYRELRQLNELIYVLRADANKRRILCAPCSSGEEVYSILMLAKEAMIDDLQVVGIDINSSVIEKAKSGVYSKRSLNNLSPYLIKKYFNEVGEEFALKREMFRNAKFFNVNVFDKKFFDLGKFDVIMSRNMMIYFDEEFKYRLVDNFAKSLNFGGLFFAGHADLVPQHEEFEKYYANSCSYYIKK